MFPFISLSCPILVFNHECFQIKGLGSPAVMRSTPVGTRGEFPTAPGRGKDMEERVQQHVWPHKKLQNVLSRCLGNWCGEEVLYTAIKKQISAVRQRCPKGILICFSPKHPCVSFWP